MIDYEILAASQHYGLYLSCETDIYVLPCYKMISSPNVSAETVCRLRISILNTIVFNANRLSFNNAILASIFRDDRINCTNVSLSESIVSNYYNM